MNEDNIEKIEMTKKIEINTLALLIHFAYSAGQEAGLKGLTYEHPKCENQRSALKELLIHIK